ncbi:MAG: glycosyltransferase family 25 protein [Porticoccaceae bacterium]
MKVEGYIIHLARAKSRLPQVKRLQASLPVTSHVIDAVDAQRLSSAQQLLYKTNVHRPRYPFAMRQSEIACFLSHRLVWQALLGSDNDAALIVEDDVDVDQTHFKAGYALACEHLAGGYVRFPKNLNELPFRSIACMGNTSLFYPAEIALGMQLQLVSREAAKQLLKATQCFDRPVDTFLQMRWLTDVSCKVVSPSGIHEIDAQLGGTTIGQKKSLWEILHREIMRPVYRFNIYLLSKVHRPNVT